MKGTEKCLVGIIVVLGTMPVPMMRLPTRKFSSGMTMQEMLGSNSDLGGVAQSHKQDPQDPNIF